MTDVKEELLQCPTPFCDGKGGEPYVFERRFDCLGVYCPTCQVSTPYFPSVEQAVTLWNTRPQPSPKVDGLDAMELLCAELKADALPTRFETGTFGWQFANAAIRAINKARAVQP